MGHEDGILHFPTFILQQVIDPVGHLLPPKAMQAKLRASGCPKPRKKLRISSRVIFPNLAAVHNKPPALATGPS